MKSIGKVAGLSARRHMDRTHNPQSAAPKRRAAGRKTRFVVGAEAAWRSERSPTPRPVLTIVNAFPPGGSNDLVTRPIASALEPVLKQPVVVETKAGAAGAVGAQVAASAQA